jgi:hypothetical protein
MPDTRYPSRNQSQSQSQSQTGGDELRAVGCHLLAVDCRLSAVGSVSGGGELAPGVT